MKTLHGLNQTVPRKSLPDEDLGRVKLIPILTPNEIFA